MDGLNLWQFASKAHEVGFWETELTQLPFFLNAV